MLEVNFYGCSLYNSTNICKLGGAIIFANYFCLNAYGCFYVLVSYR